MTKRLGRCILGSADNQTLASEALAKGGRFHFMTEEERRRPGRPTVPEDLRRRSFGISLSPRAIERLQAAAALNGISQGEYIERLFEGDEKLLRPSLYPQWKSIPFQPNKKGDLESVGRAFVGTELAQLVGAGWRVESITPTGQNNVLDVVISIAEDPDRNRKQESELFKELRTHSPLRRGFRCSHQEATNLLGESYMQKGSIQMAHRRDGPPVAFNNEEWECGCVGERGDPSDSLFMKPCSDEHQRLFESKGFTASRPFGS